MVWVRGNAVQKKVTIHGQECLQQRLQQAFDGACPIIGRLLHVGLILLGPNSWGRDHNRWAWDHRFTNSKGLKILLQRHGQQCMQAYTQCRSAGNMMCLVNAKCMYTFIHLQNRRHGRSPTISCQGKQCLAAWQLLDLLIQAQKKDGRQRGGILVRQLHLIPCSKPLLSLKS